MLQDEGARIHISGSGTTPTANISKTRIVPATKIHESNSKDRSGIRVLLSRDVRYSKFTCYRKSQCRLRAKMRKRANIYFSTGVFKTQETIPNRPYWLPATHSTPQRARRAAISVLLYQSFPYSVLSYRVAFKLRAWVTEAPSTPYLLQSIVPSAPVYRRIGHRGTKPWAYMCFETPYLGASANHHTLLTRENSPGNITITGRWAHFYGKTWNGIYRKIYGKGMRDVTVAIVIWTSSQRNGKGSLKNGGRIVKTCILMRTGEDLIGWMVRRKRLRLGATAVGSIEETPGENPGAAPGGALGETVHGEGMTIVTPIVRDEGRFHTEGQANHR